MFPTDVDLEKEKLCVSNYISLRLDSEQDFLFILPPLSLLLSPQRRSCDLLLKKFKVKVLQSTRIWKQDKGSRSPPEPGPSSESGNPLLTGS